LRHRRGCVNRRGRKRRAGTRVSGFTFVRNAIDLYYPVVESITSILPLCDEFVVAAGDSTDGTTELLRRIDSPKLRIIETVWDRTLFERGAIFAQQTDVALDHCTGDWAFYLQADEVVHERYLDRIAERLRRHLPDRRVEGLLFDYLHFFGDYDHVQTSHNWYSREVRVVRTGIGVRSWHDAQGFRRAGEKLHVAHSRASVYHYGWVRPPRNLHRKVRAFRAVYQGAEAVARVPIDEERPFGYGRLRGTRRFRGSHPAVMRGRIAQLNWTVEPTAPAGHKHDRLGIQVLSLLENRLLGFRLGERRNYVLLPGMGSPARVLDWEGRLAGKD
jgi:hypothetical protein